MLSKEKNQDRLGQVETLYINGHSLTLEDVEQVSRFERRVSLTSSAERQLDESRQIVDRLVDSQEAIYGITTGFGKFKDVYIKAEDRQKLQRNLVLSHAVGLGAKFETEYVRAALVLRANALAKGFSGIRRQVVELIINCLNAGLHPRIPELGSLGASGDLAPLAHLALVLIGEGEAEYNGEILSGQDALTRANLQPVVLEAKEGLALTNGTQIMSALGSLLVLQAELLAKTADIIGAMSLEAQLGSAKAFSDKIHAVRPHPGQIASAKNLQALLKESSIVTSHANCPMVQDAYSLRCMPQVHGASRQAFAHARQVFEIEINSATDNPLVFDDGVLSGGNFHGQPLAVVLDYMAIALAELANISERRTERLVNPALSNGLPDFLTKYGGINSGFMIAQYTAASLVSDNKVLAHPASVDSIPTSANQEDHVSMGAGAARKARLICQNVKRVLAIELLCAAQGLDFRLNSATACVDGSEHPQLKPGPGVAAAYQLVRQSVPFLEEDRLLYGDIEKAEQLIGDGSLLKAVEQVMGALA